MTRKIEIDEEVFEALQNLAEPLVDTPNTVIKRLLQEKASLKSPTRHPVQAGLIKSQMFYGGSGGIINGAIRAKAGEVTPQGKYEQWLLKTLWEDFNGHAPKAEVTQIVIQKMLEAKILKEIDFERVSTGEIRASNTIAWARNSLKDQGYIKSDSVRGIWELSEQGIGKAKILLQE